MLIFDFLQMLSCRRPTCTFFSTSKCFEKAHSKTSNSQNTHL